MQNGGSGHRVVESDKNAFIVAGADSSFDVNGDDLRYDERHAFYQEHDASITCLAAYTDTQFISGDAGGVIKVWNIDWK